MSRPASTLSVFRPVWRRNFSASSSNRAIDKLRESATDAIKDMKGSSTVLVGGFGFSGVPNTLINAVRDRPDIKDLTVVSNNAGMPGAGLGNYSTQYRRLVQQLTLLQANYSSPSKSAR